MATTFDRLKDALKDRYEIGREIGRGGMSIVYRTRDLKHEHDVALKVLRPEIAAEVGSERFLREIRVMSGLTHPYILPLLDSGAAAGTPYYVMPLIEGESLRDRLTREGPLPVDQAVRICREVAEALDYAHRSGVVHRDLKPDNVLLSEGHAVVADFGVARAIGQSAGERLTSTGVVLGTPAYMGPEQATPAGTIDGRTDIYSLGCMLYELLAGQAPYSGPTAESLLRQHLVAPIPDVRMIRSSVPGGAQSTIERAMAKSPADRYSTAGEMAVALGRLESGAIALGDALKGGAAVPAAPEVSTQAGTSEMRREPDVEATPARAHARRPTAVLVVIAVAVVIAGVTLARGPIEKALHLGAAGAASTAPRPWVWVADFDGPPDDPVLTRSVRSLVTGGLDQLGSVATVPDGQVGPALSAAELPETTRVSARVAYELAYRSHVPGAVDGEVRRIGNGFAVTLRAVDVERDSLLSALQGTARNEDDLIPVVSGLTRKLNAVLERHLPRAQSSNLEFRVSTPSFAALKLSSEAGRSLGSGHYHDGILQCQEALRIDSLFADAWSLLGWNYIDLNLPDSARRAFERAVHCTGRISERQRTNLEAVIAGIDGDDDAELAMYDRNIRSNPNSAGSWNNRGGILADRGRYEEALESYRKSQELFPVAAPSPIIFNEIEALFVLGRADEAESVTKTKLHDSFRPMGLAGAAMWRGDWNRVDSLAQAVQAGPAATLRNRHDTICLLAAARSAQGAIRDADQALAGDQRLSRSVSPPWLLVDAERRCFLGWVAGALAESPPPTGTGFGAVDPISMTLAALAAGDTTTAKRLITRIPAGPPAPRRMDEVANAWLALERRHPDEAMRSAAPILASPVDLESSKPMAEWIVASAFEARQEADSAAAHYERLLSPTHYWVDERATASLVSVFAHLKLVAIYLRAGRLDDARRHMDALDAQVTRPDPIVKRLIHDARAALESAEAMGRRPTS